MVGCQTQNEVEPVCSRLFIHFRYIRVLRQSLNADQLECLIYHGLPTLINGGVGLSGVSGVSGSRVRAEGGGKWPWKLL